MFVLSRFFGYAIERGQTLYGGMILIDYLFNPYKFFWLINMNQDIQI